ncbi:MAG: DnaJ domain-containing protein [Acetobacter sp.]|nr:DnaJ domain-containing protein [Acetobacter sp.]
MTKKLNYDTLGYYKILNVNPQSSEEEIRQKYRDLAKFWHPDHNTDPLAVDTFQQLSVAYDVLKDTSSRLKYTLLSLIYDKSNFPDINSICVIRNMHGQEDVNLRAFRLIEITGKGIGHSTIDKVYYCSQYEAASVIGSITRHNWFKGFWGISAFFANIHAITQNILNINSKKENFTLLIHNSLAYKDEGKLEEAATLAAWAKRYASPEELNYLEQYISSFDNSNLLSVKKWKFKKLKSLQLFYPFAFVLSIILIWGGIYLNALEQIRHNTPHLKQVVTFRDGHKTFSDVAVAKIFDIPVDVYRKQELYHITKDVRAMHGPDKDFDVFKTIEQGTTVRLTGYTADKKWFRVMFDNGETAFIEADYLVQGIGNEIPVWSKIYKE